MLWIAAILTLFLAAWLVLTKPLNGSACRKMLLGGVIVTLLLPLMHVVCSWLNIGWSHGASIISEKSAPQHIQGFAIVWCIGSLLSLLALVRQSIAVRALRTKSTPISHETAVQVALATGHPTSYLLGRLRTSSAITSPCVVGIRKAVIIVPDTSHNWSPQTWRCTIAHEEAHIAGRDIAWRYAFAALRIIWWFHPLAHLLASRAEAACEETCDDAVLAIGVDSRSYAETLIHLASGNNQSIPAIAAFSGSRRRQIAARLTRIMENPGKSQLPIVVALTAGLVITASMAASARIPKEPETLFADPLTKESLIRLDANPFPAD